jgi:LysR family hydrogen peroxide-inducible transcriptional activator
LAIIPTLAPYLLPLFVQKFVEQYPKVDLKIYELQTNEIIDQLRNGKIDGAVLATPLDIKELDEEFLFHEPFKVFLSKSHSLLNKKNLDENDLSIDEAWLLKEGHCLRTQTLQLCRFSRQKDNKHPFFEAGSLETLINMVKSSQGFTVLPYLACLNLSEEDNKKLRPFKQNVPVRNIGFVTGPLSMKKSIDKVVIKSIQDHLPKELKKSPAKAQVLGIN